VDKQGIAGHGQARNVLGRFLVTDQAGNKLTNSRTLQRLVDSVSAAVMQRCSELASPDCHAYSSVKAQAVALVASALPFASPFAAGSPRPRVTDDLQPDSGRDKRARLHQQEQEVMLQGASSSEAEFPSSASAGSPAAVAAASAFAAAAASRQQSVAMLDEEEEDCWARTTSGTSAGQIMSPLHVVSQDAELGQVRSAAAGAARCWAVLPQLEHPSAPAAGCCRARPCSCWP
jgi:hypothetical protein